MCKHTVSPSSIFLNTSLYPICQCGKPFPHNSPICVCAALGRNSLVLNLLIDCHLTFFSTCSNEKRFSITRKNYRKKIPDSLCAVHLVVLLSSLSSKSSFFSFEKIFFFCCCWSQSPFIYLEHILHLAIVCALQPYININLLLSRLESSSNQFLDQNE